MRLVVVTTNVHYTVAEEVKNEINTAKIFVKFNTTCIMMDITSIEINMTVSSYNNYNILTKETIRILYLVMSMIYKFKICRYKNHTTLNII